MKYTLTRAIQPMLDRCANWPVEELTLEGEELYNYLYPLLIAVMEGTLDPHTAGRTPEVYLQNLQKGRLGDFSRRLILCARDQGQVIGVLIALPEGECSLHIYTLGVLPAYRQKGVGTALLGRCLYEAERANLQQVVLDVHAANHPALNLYAKLGFEPAATE